MRLCGVALRDDSWWSLTEPVVQYEDAGVALKYDPEDLCLRRIEDFYGTEDMAFKSK